MFEMIVGGFGLVPKEIDEKNYKNNNTKRRSWKLQAKKNQQYYFQCGDLNVTLFVLLEKKKKT